METYYHTLFNYLYGSFSGYSISHDARKDHDDNEAIKDLLYGEVPFDVWCDIVQRANAKRDGVFFDLGSGTGRIIMQSYMVFDFKKVVGIELLEGLYDKSCQVREMFEKDIRHRISQKLENRELTLLNKNIFDVDLSEADLVFMNHPFKDREMFERLENKFLNEFKPGTKIITTIRSLNDQRFKSLGTKKYEFSWGESTIYYHEV